LRRGYVPLQKINSLPHFIGVVEILVPIVKCALLYPAIPNMAFLKLQQPVFAIEKITIMIV